MPEPSIHDILSKTFSPTDKDEWLLAASREIPDKNPGENLLWNIDGLTFSPYYVKDDLKEIEYLKKFHYSSYPFYSNARPWLNIPQITVVREHDANEKALELLVRGADGVLFDVSDLSDFSIEILLAKIDWNHCSISFKTSDTKIATKILAYPEQKNYDPSQLTGSLFWKRRPLAKELANVAQKSFEKFHTLGIEILPSSPVQEISGALQQGVQLMDELTDLGMNRDAVFHSVGFSFACDENFFINVAKLKAMRMLWYQVSQSFEISGHSPSHLHIHCRSGAPVDEKYEPRGNMIKNTFQAMSAVLGGCNALTINPGENGSMTDRVALNVSNILKEESHFDKVRDPLAGSYAVEKMVHEISQAAWKGFQKSLQS